MKTKTKKSRLVKWDDKFYITIYQLASEGLTNKDICKVLKVEPSTFNKWRRGDEVIDYALLQARGKKTRGNNTLQDHIFGHLSPRNQKLFKKITRIVKEPNGIRRVNKIFANRGENIRKEMFLYALANTYFDPSRAMRKVGLPKKMLDKWIEEDPQFASMVDEISYHKGNFFESKLVQLVDEGDPNVTMFANRTFNKDRGYADKVQVEHSGKVDHVHHQLVDITQLPLKLQKAVYRAMEDLDREEKKETLLLEANGVSQ